MAEYTIFRNAMLLDCTGRDPFPADVVVKGDRIESITGPGAAVIPDECAVFDLNGKTLMPGLTDAHVHVAITALDLNVMIRESAMVRACKVREALEKTLAAGFTTVRDAGGADAGMKSAIRLGYIRGPRLLTSGAMLSMTGGHGDMLPHDVALATDPWKGIGTVPRICDGADEVRKAAREQLKAGADQIKIMASGGVLSPFDELDSAQYTVDELRAAVEEAAERGRIVMAHAISARGIKNALRAGVRSIEHGAFMDEEGAEMAAELGAFVIPTISVGMAIGEAGKSMGVEKRSLDKMAAVVGRSVNGVKLAIERRLKVGSGTDSLANMHGRNALELECKVHLGMTPMESIRSATAVNAELFGLADRIGTVEPGKLSDLIVVDGSPLDDIRVLQDPGKVLMVFRSGTLMVDRRGG